MQPSYQGGAGAGLCPWWPTEELALVRNNQPSGTYMLLETIWLGTKESKLGEDPGHKGNKTVWAMDSEEQEGGSELWTACGHLRARKTSYLFCLFPSCLEPLGIQGCVAERTEHLSFLTGLQLSPRAQRSPEGKTLCEPLWPQGAQSSNPSKKTLLKSCDGKPDPEQEVR